MMPAADVPVTHLVASTCSESWRATSGGPARGRVELPTLLPSGPSLALVGDGVIFSARAPSNGAAQVGKFIETAVTEVRMLLQLPDNWDEEGAPTPSVSAVLDAESIVQAADCDGVQPSSVDPDVLGGVGLYFDSPTGEHVWVSLMNTGLRAVLFAYKGRRIATVAVTPDESWPRIKKFLAGDHSVGEV